MGRFEIHNYGRNLHFPYTPEGGQEMEIFLYRNKTERTDDEDLAELCEMFPYVGVTDTGIDFSQFTKKELVEEARKAGIEILNTHNKTKAELIEVISSATEVHSV